MFLKNKIHFLISIDKDIHKIRILPPTTKSPIDATDMLPVKPSTTESFSAIVGRAVGGADGWRVGGRVGSGGGW